MNMLKTIGLAAVLAWPAGVAMAHDDGPQADGHAPAGVMFDHMHKAGGFMLGYRYSWSGQSGDFLNGTTVVGDTPILHKACQNPVVAGHDHLLPAVQWTGDGVRRLPGDQHPRLAAPRARGRGPGGG